MTIGIDIGGSKIRGVLLSSSARQSPCLARWNGKKMLKSVEFLTPKNLKEFKKVIIGVIHVLSNNSFKVKVGIGIAGIIKNNKVVSATNIKYLKNFDFENFFKKIAKNDTTFSPTHPPYEGGGARGRGLIQVENDARCYARAEYQIGAGKGAKSMLMITLGTGVGRAYGKIENGKPVIQQIKVFEKEESWEKDYQKIKDKNKLAKFFGKKLAPIVYSLDPEIIVLGGGVVEKKGYYNAISHKLNAVSKKSGLRHMAYSVRRAKLGKFAGAIGVALLLD